MFFRREFWSSLYRRASRQLTPSLSTEDRISKLLVLKGYNDLAGQLRQYSSRVVTIPDLFRTSKIPQSFSSIVQAPAVPAPASAQAAVPGAGPGKKGAKTSAPATAPAPVLRDDASDWATASQASSEPIEWTVASKRKDKEKDKVKGEGKGWVSKAGGAGKKQGYNVSWVLGDAVRGGRSFGTSLTPQDKDKDKHRRKGATVRDLHPRPCHT
jgi:hypothetical protein